MAKWIATEKPRAGLRHAVYYIIVCPNVAGRTKEGIGQSKRARAGSLEGIGQSKRARAGSLEGIGQCKRARAGSLAIVD